MITVVDAKGEALPSEDDRWLLEESRVYVIGGVEHVECDDRKLPATAGGFEFDTGHAIGRRVLVWRAGAQTGRAVLEIRPRSDKLEPEAWLLLIDDLESWLPSVTVGFEGTRHGQVGTQGRSAGWFAEALLPLAPLLLRAVKDLTSHLRIRTLTHLANEPFRRARKASRETMAFMARHPDAAVWLDRWASVERRGQPPLVPLRSTYETLDHPANSYMRWLLRRVELALALAATRLESIGGDAEIQAWCASRASRLRQTSTELAELVRRSPLGSVTPAPPTDAALAVVLDDPRYARVQAIARRFLLPRFTPTASSDTPASVRPSYGLFELWCLLALQRSLSAAGDLEWKSVGLANLLNATGSGGGFRFIGKGKDGTLRLDFNRTFASYTNRKKRGLWSLSGERRPDFLVSWQPANGARASWIFLDAKYRVGRNLVDAFESLHIYRDALRWAGGGDKAQGGVLLAPARTDSTEAFFSAGYRADFGIGAFELRPGGDTTALAEWIRDRLGIESSASSGTETPQTSASSEGALAASA